jgi:hypothetical protein
MARFGLGTERAFGSFRSSLCGSEKTYLFCPWPQPPRLYRGGEDRTHPDAAVCVRISERREASIAQALALSRWDRVE